MIPGKITALGELYDDDQRGLSISNRALTEVNSLIEEFKDIENPRSAISRRHLLGDLIVISVMAAITDSDGPMAIALWTENQAEGLKQHIELPNGTPSHHTFIDCFEP